MCLNGLNCLIWTVWYASFGAPTPAKCFLLPDLRRIMAQNFFSVRRESGHRAPRPQESAVSAEVHTLICMKCMANSGVSRALRLVTRCEYVWNLQCTPCNVDPALPTLRTLHTVERIPKAVLPSSVSRSGGRKRIEYSKRQSSWQLCFS